MWYASASSISELQDVTSFIFDFTSVFALARYSPTVSLLFMDNFEIFTLALILLLVDL